MVHRGLAQVFDETNTDWNSNTAAMIEVPTHDYIENTIHSMQAAFDLSASAVELDIKLSKDGQLAVFHDSTLLYRCGVDIVSLWSRRRDSSKITYFPTASVFIPI